MQSLPPIDDAFKARLRDIANGSEDAWMERKPSPRDDGRDIRKTLVAFANSVEDREFAVLLIGASDDLKHPGIKDPDELQKKVDTIATQQCYPAIEYRTLQLEMVVENTKVIVLAVLVPPSRLRPHFSGPAFVRRGSRTIEASAEMMNELVASRNDKVRVLQRIKGRINIHERSTRGLLYKFPGSLKTVTPHAVEVMNESGEWWGIPLKDVEIISVETPWTAVQIPARATELEHIERMLRDWQFSQPPGQVTPLIAQENYIIKQLLPVAGEVLPIMTAMQWGRFGQETTARQLFTIFFNRVRGIR